MKIYLKNHSYKYEIQNISHIFWPEEKIVFYGDNISEDDNENEIIIISELYKENYILTGETYIFYKKNKYYHKEDTNIHSIFSVKRQERDILKFSLLNALQKIKKTNLPWGILTGIRPVKIIHELYGKGLTKHEIVQFLKTKYLVADEKINMALRIFDAQKNILEKLGKNDIALYIGIPFCPTRCLYCSFISNPIKNSEKLIEPYIKALIKEIQFTGDIIKGKNFNVKSIYIGGGTPTTLESNYLDLIIKELYNNFNLSNVIEFTVEAGRPDTIDEDKLLILKKNNVNRISINPQTMNDEILSVIGRNHRSKDIIDAYYLARKCGFDNINMDIIAGLPGESFDMYADSIEKVIGLNPESITIHTLSIKRGSRLNECINQYDLNFNEIRNILKYTYNRLSANNYNPYYLYRQKNILGNFENTGYSKKTYECVYNIQTMEETNSIIALGAGAISKIINLDNNKIERVFNVKNIEEYINRIEEMNERKKMITKFV